MSDDPTGRLLSDMLADSAAPKANALTSALWYRKRGAYFVLRTFTDEESRAISEGLQSPSTFVFSDMGNVACSSADGNRHHFRNITDPSPNTDYAVDSLEDIAEYNRQYVWDDRSVITRNLRFILAKDEDGIWRLLYNPVHTRSFRDHYRHTIRTAENLTWGKSTMRTSKHGNLKRVFDNYCEDWQVTRRKDRAEPGKKAYLDPVCNLVISQRQCAISSLFDENLVTHDPVRTNASRNVLTQLGSGDPAPYCACTGGVYNFVSANLDQEEDFTSDFLNMGECDPQLEMNICTVINQANNLNIHGSSISTKCGGGGGSAGGDGGSAGGDGGSAGGDGDDVHTSQLESEEAAEAREARSLKGLEARGAERAAAEREPMRRRWTQRGW